MRSEIGAYVDGQRNESETLPFAAPLVEKSQDECDGDRLHRHLGCEVLELSPAIDGWFGEGESDASGLGLDGGGDPAEETLLSAFGADSPLAFGVLAASANNPAVAQVEISPTPVRSLAVTFSDEVNAAALIGDGSIVSAVTLVGLSSGPVGLQATQFAYNAP